MDTSDLASILSRLDRVERQNRRLKWAGAAAVLLAAVAFVIGAAAAPKTVTAEKFVLTDADGKPCGELAFDKVEGPALLLRDKEGNRAVLLGANPNGGGGLNIRVKDKGRLELSADAGQGVGVEMKDKDGTTRLRYGVRENAQVQFEVRDVNNKLRIALGAQPDGSAGAGVFDKDGKLIWSAPPDQK